jgi:OPA family glycerol-3-phosphate transporter-like MFS transporter 1/2
LEAMFLLTWMLVFSCRFRGFILLLTFFIYTCYHMSRKPISIVKVRLAGKALQTHT